MAKISYLDAMLTIEEQTAKARVELMRKVRKDLNLNLHKRVRLELLKGLDHHDPERIFVSGYIKSVNENGVCSLDYADPTRLKNVPLFKIVGMETY